LSYLISDQRFRGALQPKQVLEYLSAGEYSSLLAYLDLLSSSSPKYDIIDNL